MSLSDLASLGSFVSGIAVLVSLIFLYFQLVQLNRQATLAELNQRAQLRQTRADRTVAVILARLEPSVALAFSKGVAAQEDLSPAEIEQFNALIRAAFFNWQETYDQYHAGLVDEAEFKEFATNVRSICAAPGVRAVWHVQQRFPLGTEFTQWVENLMARDSLGSGSIDRVEQWKRSVRELKAGPDVAGSEIGKRSWTAREPIEGHGAGGRT